MHPLPTSPIPARRARSRARRWGDSGAAAAETVIATPLLLLLLLLIVQFAVAWHAQHIAQLAASRALAAARAQGSTAAAGRAQADATLAALGRSVLLYPQVTVDRTGRQAAVEVRGQAESIVPGWHLHVAAHAAGEVERWTPSTGNG